MPGTDWIALGSDGIRRQDLRAQLTTDDGELILFRYDLALIRSSDRFAQGGRRGIVLRLGLLDGPGTGHEAPVRSLGATLHVVDAALALLAALTLPSGIYNVCRDGERVSNRRLTHAAGWHPSQ